MELNFKFRSVFLILQFIIINNFATCSEVPVILWNVKGDSLQLKPISAFGNDKKIFDESMKDVLHKTPSALLVFAVNELSMEDFSAKEKIDTTNSTLQSLETFLDNHPHMLLSSVKDPLNRIHKAHCGVEEIIVDQGIEDNVLHSVALAIERSCAVILHVSDTSIIPKNGKSDFEHIKSIFLPSFKNTKKNVVGMFSGMKSSWDVSASAHHSFRNLLAAEEGEDPHFWNYTGCIIAYAENGTLKTENETVTLTFPPQLEGSDCGNSTEVLQLTFATSGETSKVVLKFEFSKKGGSWVTKNITLQLKGAKEKVLELKGEKIEAPLGFSYSCGKLMLKDKESMTLTMLGFQVQPYEVKEKFSHSFDCVTFFTIPIWMGVFVALLFIIIVNVGVYALFSVNTMDRFDDPKGKTITVAAATD